MAHNEHKKLNNSLNLDIKIDLNPFGIKDFTNDQNNTPYKLEGKRLEFLAQFISKDFENDRYSTMGMLDTIKERYTYSSCIDKWIVNELKNLKKMMHVLFNTNEHMKSKIS